MEATRAQATPPSKPQQWSSATRRNTTAEIHRLLCSCILMYATSLTRGASAGGTSRTKAIFMARLLAMCNNYPATLEALRDVLRAGDDMIRLVSRPDSDSRCMARIGDYPSEPTHWHNGCTRESKWLLITADVGGYAEATVALCTQHAHKMADSHYIARIIHKPIGARPRGELRMAVERTQPCHTNA